MCGRECVYVGGTLCAGIVTETNSNNEELMEDQLEYLLMSQARPRLPLCSIICPTTLCVDQAGLDYTEIWMLLPPKCWD